MRYDIKKPEGTFYSDYVIKGGKCFAIFEHDVRQTTKFVCHTEKDRVSELKETTTSLIIEI